MPYIADLADLEKTENKDTEFNENCERFRSDGNDSILKAVQWARKGIIDQAEVSQLRGDLRKTVISLANDIQDAKKSQDDVKYKKCLQGFADQIISRGIEFKETENGLVWKFRCSK
jgi:hypothetical protein